MVNDVHKIGRMTPMTVFFTCNAAVTTVMTTKPQVQACCN